MSLDEEKENRFPDRLLKFLEDQTEYFSVDFVSNVKDRYAASMLFKYGGTVTFAAPTMSELATKIEKFIEDNLKDNG